MSASSPPAREPICNTICDRLPRPRRRPCWVPLHYGVMGLLHAGAVLLVIWLANHPGAVLNTGLARGAVAPVRATLLSAEWLAAQRRGRQRAQPAAAPTRETAVVAAKSAASRDLRSVPTARVSAPSPRTLRSPALPKRHAPKLALHQRYAPETSHLAAAKPPTAAPDKPPKNDTPRPMAASSAQAQSEQMGASEPMPISHAAPSAAAAPFAPASPPPAAQLAATGGSAAPVGRKATAAVPLGGPLITEAHYRQPPQPEAYPPLARRRGWQGTVLIEVWLDGEGEQLKRQILQSSGHAVLDQAALRSVARNQFAPYTVDGIGQPARLHLPVIFSLNAP